MFKIEALSQYMTDIVNGITEYQSTTKKDDLKPFLPYMIENGTIHDLAVILNRFQQNSKNDEYLELVIKILDFLLDVSSDETDQALKK